VPRSGFAAAEQGCRPVRFAQDTWLVALGLLARLAPRRRSPAPDFSLRLACESSAVIEGGEYRCEVLGGTVAGGLGRGLQVFAAQGAADGGDADVELSGDLRGGESLGERGG
jgi:hypothetical protein